MTDAVPAAPPPRRNWSRILLIASIALNALLIGVIVRGLWIARTNLALSGGAAEASIPSFLNSLPQERREELRRGTDLTERPAGIRPLRMEVRRARAETTRAFLADPFDKQAFVAAQERLLESETNLRRAIHDILPELGERLTATERRAYLNWRGHRGHGDRRGRWRNRTGDGDEPATGSQRN